jgi:predicted RNA-binding Zn ribbon-like protein
LVTSHDSTRSVAIRAITNAIELIHDHPDRIRSCDRDDCVLWFLDTSKAGRRRWCSMERCGNRTKAQRHHQRTIGPATNLA